MIRNIIISLLLLIPIITNSTSIFIYIIGDRLFVSADSKMTYIKDGKRVFLKTICKVQSYKNYCYAVAGHTSEKVNEQVDLALREGNDQNSRAEIFISRVTAYYTNRMTYEKTNDTASYNLYLTNKLLAEVAIMYFINKVPNIDYYAFLLKENGNGDPTISCEKYLHRSEIALGSNQPYPTVYEYENFKLLNKNNPERIGEMVVRHFMKYNSETVGEPIDVMEVLPTGLKYYSPKRHCK